MIAACDAYRLERSSFALLLLLLLLLLFDGLFRFVRFLRIDRFVRFLRIGRSDDRCFGKKETLTESPVPLKLAGIEAGFIERSSAIGSHRTDKRCHSVFSFLIQMSQRPEDVLTVARNPQVVA